MGQHDKIRLLIGTYTQPEGHVPNGGGAGVLSCELDCASGEVRFIDELGGVTNPSFVHFDGAGRTGYAISETGEDGVLHAIAVGDDGKLQARWQTLSHGGAGCFVTKSGDAVYVAAYVGGCVARHALAGGVAVELEAATYQGAGPNEDRQEAPHAHQALTSPDGNWLLVCDLGADRVWAHDLREPWGPPQNAFSAPPGSGPRHLCFHPELPLVYLICELTGDLLTLELEPETGDLTLTASCNTLPQGYDGDPASAAIRLHPSGRTLAVSNRFCDVVGVYDVDGGGALTPAQQFSCGGKTPRDMAFSPCGRWLIVGNQDSDTLAVFAVDAETGLVDAASMQLHDCRTPSCIAFPQDL